MTLKQLRDYRTVKGHVKMLKTQRDDLILRSLGGAGSGVRGGVSKPVENISKRREKLEQRIQRREAEIQEVDEYIDGCEETIGTMLRLHYVLGKSWTNVAIRAGGNNTKDSVRMMCHRYIKKNP